MQTDVFPYLQRVDEEKIEMHRMGWIDHFMRRTSDIQFLKNKRVYFLMIELLLFYGNIIGQIMFIMTSKFFNYTSMQDRMLMQNNQKKYSDFLEYAQLDVEWYILWWQNFLTSVVFGIAHFRF